MMIYRLINNEAPKYLTSLFERLSQNTVRELRNTKTDHKLPLLKISSGKRCFSYRGARLWNNLSADAKNSQTISQFKTVSCSRAINLSFILATLVLFSLPVFICMLFLL